MLRLKPMQKMTVKHVTMESSDSSQNNRSFTIQSDALYTGEFTATENSSQKGGRLFSGTRLKAIIVPFLYRLLNRVPVPVAALPMKLLLFAMRLAYYWPNNPIRQACVNVCKLAELHNNQHNPKAVYRQLITNSDNTLDNYFRLYRHGVESVADRVHISSDDAVRINRLAEEHGGVVIAVPHNFASLFSALKMSRAFSLICVTRNPSTIERTKIGVDFFERMNVRILMVRGGNPFELSRTLFSILKSGNAIAATVDSMDHSEAAAITDIFGMQVGFPTWAAKIAAKKSIPVVPSYFRTNGKQVYACYGEEIITNSTEQIVQHYVKYFEKNILEDPASWAYLADKRWRRVLQEATN